MSAATEATDQEPEAGEGGKPMTFWEHLEELRRRLVYAVSGFLVCVVIAWGFKERLFAVVTQPFIAGWQAQGIHGTPTLHFGTPAAAFTGYVKLSVVAGAVLAAPVILYQGWSFIAPGLYAREKRYVIPFVGLSSSLFAGGVYFGWRFAFPLALGSLLGYSGNMIAGSAISLQPTVMIGDYIDFVTWLSLGYGVVSEIPLIVAFLAMAGVVNYKQLLRVVRWFVLAAFVASAVIAPPDVGSMLVLAVPSCILYFVGIGLAYLFGKKPAPEEEAKPKKKKKKKVSKPGDDV